MDEFIIDVIFRRSTAYLNNSRVLAAAPSGNIRLVTNRCNVEDILASMNVLCYKISSCSNPLQETKRFEMIPEFYYEKEKKI